MSTVVPHQCVQLFSIFLLRKPKQASLSSGQTCLVQETAACACVAADRRSRRRHIPPLPCIALFSPCRGHSLLFPFHRREEDRGRGGGGGLNRILVEPCLLGKRHGLLCSALLWSGQVRFGSVRSGRKEGRKKKRRQAAGPMAVLYQSPQPLPYQAWQACGGGERGKAGERGEAGKKKQGKNERKNPLV